MMRISWAVSISAALAGCSDPAVPPEPEDRAGVPAAAAPAPEPPLHPARREAARSIVAEFVGWEGGERASAHLRLPQGDEIVAWTSGGPIDAFLTAHQDVPLTITLADPESETEGAGRIVDAAGHGMRAEDW
jgi:hypothetical protein